MDISSQLAQHVASSWDAVSSLWVPMAWTFFLLFSICYPLEMVFPARRQSLFRKGWATDCVFFLVQHSAIEGFMLTLFTAVAACVLPLAPIQGIHGLVSRFPMPLQFLLVILSGDALGYLYHRAMHGNSWLWPFHAVHHSVEEPDWLSAHREHPIDLVLGSFCVTLPFILLGVSMELAMPLIVFRGFWSLYLHSNLALSIGPLQILFGSPQLHRWHHSLENNRCNYSNYSPWLDIVFGTYRAPKIDPERYGIRKSIPDDFVSYCVHPFQQNGARVAKVLTKSKVCSPPTIEVNRNEPEPVVKKGAITRYIPGQKKRSSSKEAALKIPGTKSMPQSAFSEHCGTQQSHPHDSPFGFASRT